MLTRLTHKISTISLIFAILINQIGILLTPKAVLAESTLGTPWYEVQIQNSTYIVYLNSANGQSIAGPLDENVHGASISNIYVVEKASQQLVTDPKIAKWAVLLAQNRAITSVSSSWMNYLSHLNHITFYVDNEDYRGRLFDVALPSFVTDLYAKTLINGRFGNNLKNAENRRSYYKEVVKSMVFPVLKDEEIQNIETQFERDLGGLLEEAYSSASASGISIGTVEWASAVVSYIEGRAEIVLESTGKSTTFIGGFGQFLAGFGLALGALSIADIFDQISTEAMLKVAYMQAMGEDRLSIMYEFAHNPSISIDPVLPEAVDELVYEVSLIDQNSWTQVITTWFQNNPVGSSMTMLGIVTSIATIAAQFFPPTALAVAFIGVVYSGFQIAYNAWEWLDNRDDLVSVAGIAKTLEYTMCKELEARFSTTPPSVNQLEKWLLFSNMRLFADHMFYDLLRQRLDWYDSIIYFFWDPFGTTYEDAGAYLTQEANLRWNSFIDTLPRVYWAYDDAIWLLTITSTTAPDSPPTLTLPNITPGSSGDTNTEFVFSIQYTDLENNAPLSVAVLVDGIQYTLSSSDITYADGAVFISSPHTFNTGAHSYYFKALQGTNVVTTSPLNFYITESAVAHDLTIVSYSLSRTSGQPGDLVTLRAQINNNGNYTENVTADVTVTGPGGYVWTETKGLGSLTSGGIWGQADVTSWRAPNSAQNGEYFFQLRVSPTSGDEDWSDNIQTRSMYISDEDPFAFTKYRYKFYQLSWSFTPGLPPPYNTWGAYGPASISYGGKTYQVWATDSGADWMFYIKDTTGVVYLQFIDGEFNEAETDYVDNNKLMFGATNMMSYEQYLWVKLGYPESSASINPGVESIPIGQFGTYTVTIPCTTCNYDSSYIYTASGGNDPPREFFHTRWSSSLYNISGLGPTFTVSLSPMASGIRSFAFDTREQDLTTNNFIVFGKVNGYVPVDNPPTITVNSPLNNQVIYGSFNVTATASDDHGINRVDFAVDGSVRNSDTASPYTYSWPTQGYPDGPHTLTATAYDTSGKSTSQNLQVVVDNTAPAISEVTNTPSSPTNITPVIVHATITDATSITVASLEYSTNNGISWTQVNMQNMSGQTWQAEIPAQNDGTILYRLKTTDSLARTTTTTNFTYTVQDVSAPVFFGWEKTPSDLTEDSVGPFRVIVSVMDIGGGGLGTHKPQIDYHFGGTSYDGYEDMLSSGGNGWYLDIPAQDWDALQGQSVFYKVQASDTFDNQSVSDEQVEWINPLNDAPVIQTFSPASLSLEIAPGNCQLFTISATDEDGDPISYQWRLNGSLVSSTSSYTYCPTTIDVGLHSLAILVLDGSLIDEKSWTVTVGENEDIPDIDVRYDPVGISIASGDTSPSPEDGTDFDGVDVSSGTRTHAFRITNAGNSDLLLIGNPPVTISGPNASDFSIPSQPATTVAPGESTTFNVEFNPSDLNTRAATVSIFNNDGDKNPYTFAIQGTGTDLNPVPVINSLDPSTATAGDGTFTLVVNGDSFISGSVVRWDDGDRATTLVSSSQVTASINAEDIAAAGTIPVTVYNPAPGGGTSLPVNFTINPLVTPQFTDINAQLIGVMEGSVDWGDYDNDEDLDLLVTGWTQSDGSARDMRIYRNDGNGVFTSIIPSGEIIGGGSSASWGDYDNDGDLDFLAMGYTGMNPWTSAVKIYQNNQGQFVETTRALPIWSPYWSTSWKDYDQDGDLDILLGPKILRNDKTMFTEVPTGFASMSNPVTSTWGDYDNDGDVDVLITGWSYPLTYTYLYRNDGNGSFTEVLTNLPGIQCSSIDWGDYDNDGDMDLLLVGSQSDGSRISRVYRNDGNLSFTDIAAGLPGGAHNESAWGDYDNDGDLDILLTGEGFAYIYRNDGNETFTNVNTLLISITYNSVAWGDYDNDGDLDIAINGTTDQGLVMKIFRNDSVSTRNQSPSSPANLNTLLQGNNVRLTWSPSADDHTPTNGLNYNVRLGTTPGGQEIISPMAQISSGFRSIPATGNTDSRLSTTLLNLAPGTYFWSVQAIDSSFAGSPFADEISFTVSQPGYNCSAQAEITVSSCQALVALYNSTNGPGWTNHTGWLETNTPCSWYGISCLTGEVVNINLGDNGLVGTIPPELTNLHGLQTLGLNSNQINGMIPPQLGNLVNLKSLELSFNQLSGSIPGELGNLSNLQYLGLYNNHLTGSIPAQLGSLVSLRALDLSNNQISGPVPEELGGLSYLDYLNLGLNQLSGSIPSQLSNSASLRVINLFRNQLTGSIPSQLASIDNLQTLDLSYNQLSGAIPVELGSLHNLIQLYLNNNQLDGPIPIELGSIAGLQHLFLGSNKFTGTIPSELGNLANLQSMSLEYNLLNGAVPLSITSLTDISSFTFNDTYLCEPDDPVFQTWKDTVTTWQGTSACFTVSGHVTDGFAGISGVTVSAGPYITAAVTDGAGSYTMADLRDGIYTLTPYLAGYAFTPPSREVTLISADIIGIDFTSVESAPQISNIRVSNIRDTSVTISWTTDINATGQVEYGTTNALGQVVYDIRGNATNDDTHYVVLSGLAPGTTYFFDVVSGLVRDNNSGSHYSVVTGSTISVPPADTVYGRVYKPDRTALAAGSIVYLRVKDVNSQGSSGQSQLLSAIVGTDGYWYRNLGEAREEPLSNYFSYSPTGDKVSIEVEGASDCRASLLVDTSADSPVQDIILSCTRDTTLSISTGWNLMSMPLQPVAPYQAQSLLSAINEQGGTCSEIDRWLIGGWNAHIDGLPFNNFEVTLANGYFSKCTSASNWILTGYDLTGPVPVNINTGWNLIGVPYPSSGYTAQSLLDGINGQGGSCSEIDRWLSGGWDAHINGLPFNNFTLLPDQGYFVKCAQSSTFTSSPQTISQSLQQVPGETPALQPSANAVTQSIWITDRRDVSVSVTWQMDAPTTGWVEWGETEQLGKKAYDERGADIVSTLHRVTLSGLTPETAYFLQIHAGETLSDIIPVHTTATGNLHAPFTVYGQVMDALGQPAQGAVVLAEYRAADGTLSEPMTRLVDQWGYWNMSLPIDTCEGLTLVLKAVGTDGSLATLEHAVCASQPAPTMQLVRMHAFQLFLPTIRSR